MQQIVDIRSAHLPGPTYLTLGNFDGMHRGHCALLETLRQKAEAQAGACTAFLTFDPHPLKVLRPEIEHLLLTSPAERLIPAAHAGIDYGIVQPFNREIAALSAQGFLNLLKTHLGLAGLVVGPDFALGRNREGTIERLRELGHELNYTVQVLDPVDWEGRTVRSSVIREQLQAGNVADAWRLLDRPYHATGTVIEGDKRGRLLGTPTANLQLADDKLWPADGVYATRAWVLVAGRALPYWSVTNLGVRPTVDGRVRRFETHLLDFPDPDQPADAARETDFSGENVGAEPTVVHDGDLYGQPLTVEFVARLRGEKRFEGLEELKAQIQADIVAAREIFATRTLPEKCIFVGRVGTPANGVLTSYSGV